MAIFATILVVILGIIVGAQINNVGMAILTIALIWTAFFLCFILIVLGDMKRKKRWFDDNPDYRY
jgi:uncharacterized membrane protein YcaP (DUF421 family)